MPFDYEASRAKTQRTLREFLDAELKIGSTFVQTALIARDAGHMQHYIRAKEHALKAIESTRRFKNQVTDDIVRQEIENRLLELERRVSTL